MDPRIIEWNESEIRTANDGYDREIMEGWKVWNPGEWIQLVFQIFINYPDAAPSSKTGTLQCLLRSFGRISKPAGQTALVVWNRP